SGAIHGREKESLSTFMEYLTYLGKYAAEHGSPQPQAFLKYDGSGGIGILQGQSDKLLELWESDDFRDLLSKGQLTVRDLHTEMYASGESVQMNTASFTQLAASMGYM
ncbi:MAG: hypothetical protein QOK47_342, partial [Actinomycetota bacterium]|nr:hypothetical protein [Actinomycetota bacterium]